ncbi:TetR/AcrR family transcriptional regulator [Pedobacter sp. MC2016-15]|uniref:TetR/AcrR family transcriptional regulator n=1 Tax=Pedobacter sp. MC2016-15 TaxID=2994473 RepID=UPI002246FBBD|nr:TetR/AcrR family transcriptional regulator [Pedobacter sp. MC2016-15]MCX2477854.1 TetR/AcrR family transcriptional regulator [Pedobacter sp. MC2016-15]
MEKDEIVIEEILSGAKKLFGKHGLKKTTMEEIATAAGKGKSTLYYYFPSKNEIFEAVVEDEMKNVVKRIREAVNASLTAKDKLKAFLQAQITSIIGFHSFREVLFDDLLASMRMLIWIKSRYEQIQIDMIKEILLGGCQSGEFKEMSADRMNKMSFVMVTAFRGLHFPLSIELSELQTNEYFDEMIDMLIAGIGNDSFKKKIE